MQNESQLITTGPQPKSIGGVAMDAKAKKFRESFRRRKYERFCDPPRWVMVERTFEMARLLRANKLYYEDYSSSSDDEGYWDYEVDQYLSDGV